MKRIPIVMLLLGLHAPITSGAASLVAPHQGTVDSPSRLATVTPRDALHGVTDCPKCSPETRPVQPAVQEFSIPGKDNLSFGNVVANSGGHLLPVTVIDASESTVQVDPKLMVSVPEPQAFAMLLVGLGLIGFSTRRKHDDDN